MDYTEALLVEFDPSRVKYVDILKHWRSMGSPYPAYKAQYRFAIFTLSDEQERVARAFCQGMQFVDIEPVTKFYRAEEYHQDFLKKQR